MTVDTTPNDVFTHQERRGAEAEIRLRKKVSAISFALSRTGEFSPWCGSAYNNFQPNRTKIHVCMCVGVAHHYFDTFFLYIRDTTFT